MAAVHTTVGAVHQQLEGAAVAPASQGNARRRRKKRVERDIPRTEEDIEREKLLEDDDVRSPHKVFVGGLGHNTTGATLRAYFEQFGKVALCAVVRHRRSGRSRGFAFVSFEDASVAESVAGGRHVIDGVAVECRRALPRSETRKAPPADCLPHPTKVFVGGLPDGVTEDELRQFCSAFGTVDSVNVAFDKQTHRPRGFGFVVFRDESSIQKAVGFHEFCGKTVEVKAAVPRDPTEPLPTSTSLPQMPTLCISQGSFRNDSFLSPVGSLSTAASLFEKTASVPCVWESPPGLYGGLSGEYRSPGNGFPDLNFNPLASGGLPSFDTLRTSSLDAAFNQLLSAPSDLLLPQPQQQQQQQQRTNIDNLSYLCSLANCWSGELAARSSMDFFGGVLESQHSTTSLDSSSQSNQLVVLEPWKRLSSGCSTAQSYALAPDSPSTTCTTHDFTTVDSSGVSSSSPSPTNSNKHTSSHAAL